MIKTAFEWNFLCIANIPAGLSAGFVNSLPNKLRGYEKSEEAVEGYLPFG